MILFYQSILFIFLYIRPTLFSNLLKKLKKNLIYNIHQYFWNLMHIIFAK